MTRTPRSRRMRLGVGGGRAVGAPQPTQRARMRAAFSAVMHVLQRRRHQHVAVELQRGARVGSRSPREPGDPAALRAMRHDRLEVEPVGVRDRALVLGEPDEDRAALLQELGRVVADVAQALNHHALAGQSRGQAELAARPRRPQRLADAEEDPAPGRLAAAPDAALANRLAGDAGDRVDLAGVQLRVGVGDPGHLARAACRSPAPARPRRGR